MAVNFTAADRVGSIGGYIGGISALAGMLGFGGCNGYNMGGCCSENTPVSRFELEQENRIAKLESEKALLEAENGTDAKMLEMYKYVDSRLNAQEQQMAQIAAAQAVTNQKLADDVKFFQHDLDAKIAAEKQARCCADNSIVNYANATFYAKLVAGVTAGSTTTPQDTYNPLPVCGPCPSQQA